MARQCGECQLCCKLTPVVEARSDRNFLKVANQKCPFQKHHKGCTIYHDFVKRPHACFVWKCRWLTGKDTEDLPRPDRAGYVIDEAPDMIILRNDDTGEETKYPAIQIWVGLRKSMIVGKSLMTYMDRMADKGYGIILRQDEKLAGVCLRLNGVWNTKVSEASLTHAPADIARVWREHGLS